jgi:uncharacterized membrane protein YfcA
MDAWTGYGILLAVGFVAGTVNVVAGGGSFLTLPLLIFLGLPATVANATNRVGILAQNVGAVWGFHRHGVLERRLLPWIAAPAVLGAVVGTWTALVVGDRALQRILALLMVVLTLWTLWDPLGRMQNAPGSQAAPPAAWLAAAFFVVGFYGGFIQAGVGFLILAATTLAGLDLVRGNALKVLCVLLFTPVSLALFAWHGTIAWPEGLSLAAGTVLGGQLGVRMTVLKGHRWVKAAVTVTVVIFAIKLWLSG